MKYDIPYRYEEGVEVTDKVIETLPSTMTYNMAHKMYQEMLKDERISMEETRQIIDLLSLFLKMDYGC